MKKDTRSNIEPLESRIAPAVFIVTNVNDSGTGSLRAELAASDLHGGFNEIVFHLPAPPAHGANVITLATGALTTAGNIAIIGPGAGKLIINGANASRDFVITGSGGLTSISGVSIINGQTSGYGGGIDSVESLNLNGVVISGNTSGGGGGGVNMSGNATTVVNISNSFINGNSSDTFGGGLDLTNLKSLTIKSTVVSGNFAGGEGGGGIYASVRSTGVGMSIIGTNITGNSAYYGGGLILKDKNPSATSKIIVADTTISGNTSTNAGEAGGGGLYLGGGNTIIFKSSILDNTAGCFGGGIESNAQGSLTVAESIIAGNQTKADGGGTAGGAGLFVDGQGASEMPVQILTSQIIGNRSVGYGGGIFARDGVKLTISGSAISGNGASLKGGGVATSNAGGNPVDLIAMSSAFSDNASATQGGGISAFGGGPVTITNSKVTGNAAGTATGGIIAYSLGTVTVKDSLVAFNSSGSGGAGGMEFTDTTFHVTGGAVIGNITNGGGGGIYAANSTGSILGVTVSSNVAVNQGGGVLNGGLMPGKVTVQIAMVTGNTAEAGPEVSGTFTYV